MCQTNIIGGKDNIPIKKYIALKQIMQTNK